jgi:DNA-binding transcriptional regulator YdaS (Cro superfamily)
MNLIIEKAIAEFGTQQKLAKACNVSQAAVHKWLNGKSLPSAKSAKAIETATNGKIKASLILPEIFN